MQFYITDLLKYGNQFLAYIPIIFGGGHELNSLGGSPCHLQNVSHGMSGPAVIAIQFQPLQFKTQKRFKIYVGLFVS